MNPLHCPPTREPIPSHARIIAIIFLAVSISPATGFDSSQDVITLDQVLERMEEAAKGTWGTRFDLSTPGRLYPLPGSIEVAKDGTVRIRHGPTMHRNRFGLQESVLGEGAFYFIGEYPLRYLERRPMGVNRTRVSVAERADFDVFRAESSNYFLSALSPRRSFAFEPNLRFLGRRRMGNREFYILQSQFHSGQGPFKDKRPVSRKFWVGTDDFHLYRVETRSFPAGWKSEHVRIWKAESFDGALPTTVSLWSGQEFWARFQAIHVQKGAVTEASRLLPSASDVYLPGVAVPQLEKRLAESPDDPELNYCYAYSFREQISAGKGVPETVFQALEKVVAKRWAASPARNLMSLYLRTDKMEKLGELASRVANDPQRTPEIALDAATALNVLGRFDQALSLLDKLEGVPRDLFVAERAYAELGKGNPSRAVGEIASAGDDDIGDVLAFILSEISDKDKRSSLRSSLLQALDQAIASVPDSEPLHVARLRILAEPGDAAGVARAAAATFKQSSMKRAHALAMDLLAGLLQEGEWAQKFDPQTVKSSFKDVLAALDAAGTRPGAQALKGRAYAQEGDRESAGRAFVGECDVLSKQVPQRHDWAATLVRSVRDFGDDDLLERASRLALEAVRGLEPEWRYFDSSSGHAVRQFATLCLKRQKYSALYQGLKGIDFRTGTGYAVLSGLQLSGQDMLAMAAAARDEALKHPDDVEGLKWIGRTVGLYRHPDLDPQLSEFVADLYERASVRATQDAEVLEQLVEWRARAGNVEGAWKAYDRLKTAFAVGAPCPEASAPEAALVEIAEELKKAGKREEAASTLSKIDLPRVELAPWIAWRVGELFESAGEDGRALAFFGRVEEDGYLPYMRLARLHTRRENWMEAMRNLNRAAALGFDADIPEPQGRILGWKRAVEPSSREESDPAKLKERLYQKVGRDYFIDRLIESNLPALSEDERNRARSALALLAGEDPSVRDGAMKDLRQLGPKCAPTLRSGLRSADAEVRSRLHSLLSDWAEPR